MARVITYRNFNIALIISVIFLMLNAFFYVGVHAEERREPLPTVKVPLSLPTHPKAINGLDERKLIPETLGSLKGIIGHLKGGYITCTAFASGESEITTAAHCMLLGREPLGQEFVTGTGDVYKLTEIIAHYPKADIVTVKTDKDFPGKFLQSGSLEANQPVKIVSYDPSQKKIIYVPSCKINTVTTNGVIQHSCDTLDGASGSPIIQNEKIVAIHLGYIKGLNVAVPFEAVKSVDITGLGIIGEATVEVCEGQYIKVNGFLAGTCASAIFGCMTTCPATVVTGGVEPVSDSACGISLLTAKLSCGISITGLLAMLVKCIIL